MLSVRASTYRGKSGFLVCGTYAHGGSFPVRIFTRLEPTARAIVAALKADDRETVSRLLREEVPPSD